MALLICFYDLRISRGQQSEILRIFLRFYQAAQAEKNVGKYVGFLTVGPDLYYPNLFILPQCMYIIHVCTLS